MTDDELTDGPPMIALRLTSDGGRVIAEDAGARRKVAYPLVSEEGIRSVTLDLPPPPSNPQVEGGRLHSVLVEIVQGSILRDRNATNQIADSRQRAEDKCYRCKWVRDHDPHRAFLREHHVVPTVPDLYPVRACQDVFLNRALKPRRLFRRVILEREYGERNRASSNQVRQGGVWR